MNAESYARLRAVFVELCELPPDVRTREAADRFSDEPELQHQLQRLLHHVDRESEVLESRAVSDAVRSRLIERMESSSAGEDLTGEVIEGYTIERRLGAGWMSTVYLARASGSGAPVALKVFEERGRRREAHKGFEREAAALAQLDHPGIARLHGAGTATIRASERAWIATEYVEGFDLMQHARARGLDITQRIDLLRYVCLAVHHAHERGVVHLDLKPSNIIVTPSGQPKVLDFGIARLMGEEIDAETAGRERRIMGTVAYMSPEQTESQSDPDLRSDLYTLGVLGYQLLTGRLPYDLAGRPIDEQLRAIRKDRPRPPGEINPRLAGDIASVLRKALAKEPAHRYASARALASDLHQVVRKRPADVELSDQDQRRPIRTRVRKAMPAIVGVILAGLGFLAGIFTMGQFGEGPDTGVSMPENRVHTLEQNLDEARDQLLHMMSVLRFAADAHLASERFEDAVRLYAELLRIESDVLGAAHPQALATAERLSEALAADGDVDEAQAVLEDTLRRRIEAHGPDDWRTVDTRVLLADVLAMTGDDAGALRQLRAALESRRRELGESDPVTIELEERVRTMSNAGVD